MTEHRSKGKARLVLRNCQCRRPGQREAHRGGSNCAVSTMFALSREGQEATQASLTAGVGTLRSRRMQKRESRVSLRGLPGLETDIREGYRRAQVPDIGDTY